MNALIAFAVWCQPHGPVTVLTTQHRRLSSFPPLASSLRIQSSPQPTSTSLQYPESPANGLDASASTKPSSAANGGNSNNSTQSSSLSVDAAEPLHPSSFSSSSSNSNSSNSSSSNKNGSKAVSTTLLNGSTTGAMPASDKTGPNSNSNSNSNSNNSSHQANQGSIRSTRSPQPVSAASTPALSGNASASLTPSNSTSNPAATSPGLDQRKASRRSLQPSSGSSQSPVSTRPTTPATSAYPHHQSSSNQGGSDSTCECKFSIPTGEKSLHTIDSTMDSLAYISQPSPVDSSLFAPIRMACIRAFNSEKFCGKEGAVFFGDGVNGYVLTYMFLVSDPLSRGQHVKYAIMTMMTDRVYLVASMEYLISQFKRVAANLQAMASVVAHTTRAPLSPAIRSASFSSHRGSIIPDSSMGPTRRGRPLPDVVGKPDIFIRLHSAFVAILSSCSQRLFERHIVGRPMPRDNSFDIARNGVRMLESPVELADGEESPPPVVTIDSLRELRRVLGRQKFDRFIWNALIGNQVIIRGSETRIVAEIVMSLEDVLPKDCCTVVINSSNYEPSYACNILGLHRSVGIPPDMDPNDFVLLDICTSAFGNQMPTPPTSMPILPSQSTTANGGSNTNPTTDTPKPAYQAEWPDSESDTPDMQELQLDVAQIALSKDGQQQLQASTPRGPPKSMPTGVSCTSDAGFQAQRRIYYLQAGEESPQPMGSAAGWSSGAGSSPSPSPSPGSKQHQRTQSEIKNGGGRSSVTAKQQRPVLFVERVNEILDLKLPRQLEKKRFSILREEWISITKQFHNLYKARLASDEATVDRFLQTMMVDPRDLKVLRCWTRCVRSLSRASTTASSVDDFEAV